MSQIEYCIDRYDIYDDMDDPQFIIPEKDLKKIMRK